MSLGAADHAGVPAFAGRDRKYLRLLLGLLLTASFFEGYDGGILDIIKPNIQDTFGLSEFGLGVVTLCIRLGAVAAFFVAMSADWVGRRPILLWSVVAYTIFTALTAVAPSVVVFVVFQFLAQIFLGSEYAIAVTMISEEFPVERRGRALGIFSFLTAAGVILVPVLALIPFFIEGPLEWRSLYVVGILPLVLTSVLRRKVKETHLFLERKAEAEAAGVSHRLPFWAPWQRQYRYFTTVMAFVTFCRSFPIFAATAWWVWYAQREAGLPQQLVLMFMIGAYGLGIVGYFVCGRLIDAWGRKPVVITFSMLAWVFASALFLTRAVVLQAVLVVGAVFFGLGMAPAINAFYTELFPTRIRAMAAAWSRNVFEVPGIVLGPMIVGLLGDHGSGVVGSMGSAEAILLGLLPVTAFVAWRYLPETRGRDLELLDAGMA